jgi:hypothetical protein
MDKKMKIKALVSVFAAGVLAANFVNAADIGTSINLGTTGLGLHVSTPLAPNLNARVGINFASHSYSDNTSDVDYDLKLKLATFDALLDYHPFAGAFRLSGGVVYNGNKFTAKAKPNSNGTFTINDNSYSAATAGSIEGDIDFRKVAPYLGIGWGNAVKEAGWGFAMDLGAILQGSPNSKLNNTGCTAQAAACSRLHDDIAAENAKLNDKMHGFRAYPVVRAGVSYRF